MAAPPSAGGGTWNGVTVAARETILCVDDEAGVLTALQQQLTARFGHECEIALAQSADDAIELMDELKREGEDLAVVIADQIMPGMKGVDLLEVVHKRSPETYKILLTGQAGLDAVVSAKGETPFDAVEELTDRFYVVLAELHAQVRRWEAAAPPAEKMTPATLARLWDAALEACAAKGQRIDDAYGRRLRLSRLPPDLLSLTDPRAVVVVATRLTEDVENWARWVQRERP